MVHDATSAVAGTIDNVTHSVGETVEDVKEAVNGISTLESARERVY